jgi:acyl carrier protein
MLANNVAGEIPRDLFEFIKAMICAASATAKAVEITSESLLIDDLGMDSLDIVRVIMNLEDRYHLEIDLDEAPRFERVRDLALTVAGRSLAAA